MKPRDGSRPPHHSLATHTDGSPALRLAGDIDVSNAAEIEAVLRLVTAEKPKVLVLDLEAVTFLDTAGVRLVLQAHRWQHDAGNGLRLVPGEGVARRVLEVSGLAARVEVEG